MQEHCCRKLAALQGKGWAQLLHICLNCRMPFDVFSSPMPVSPSVAARWHMSAGGQIRLLSPWSDSKFVSGSCSVTPGSSTLQATGRGPLRGTRLLHRELVRECYGFTERQITGRLSSWVHSHRFLKGTDAQSCVVEDRVQWTAPRWTESRIRPEVARLLHFRHRRALRDLSREAECPSLRRLTVGITGARGFVGSTLSAFLSAAGHQVVPIGRTGSEIDAPPEGLDALVHLAGAGLANRRWSSSRKKLLFSSRVDVTKALCSTLARMQAPPPVLICASGIGYYGSGAQESPQTYPGSNLGVDESARAGSGFLAELALAWEGAAEEARAAGLRVVHLRLGMIVARSGGALGAMEPAFRIGVGGRIGSGRQWVPWIHMDDVLGIVHRAIIDHTFAGPYNAVAPGQCTQYMFARDLARSLNRPSLLPLPAWMVRTALGQMGDELLLRGVQAVPARLQDCAYRYAFSDIESALRFEYGLFDH